MNCAFATKWCDAGASRRSWGPAPTLPPHPSGWDETDALLALLREEQTTTRRPGRVDFVGAQYGEPRGASGFDER